MMIGLNLEGVEPVSARINWNTWRRSSSAATTPISRLERSSPKRQLCRKPEFRYGFLSTSKYPSLTDDVHLLISGLVLKQASEMAATPPDEPLPALRAEPAVNLASALNGTNHHTNDGLHSTFASSASGLERSGSREFPADDNGHGGHAGPSRGGGSCSPGGLGGHSPSSSASGDLENSGACHDEWQPRNKQSHHFRPWLSSSSASKPVSKPTPYARPIAVAVTSKS